VTTDDLERAFAMYFSEMDGCATSGFRWVLITFSLKIVRRGIAIIAPTIPPRGPGFCHGVPHGRPPPPHTHCGTPSS
jgi:hypothetical protein